MVGTLAPHGLTTEYAENPLGIDEPAPRFSWLLAPARSVTPSSQASPEPPGGTSRQTAYQIRVASSAELLQAGQGDVWDSGQVRSERTTQVEFAGAPLRSATRYVWTVRVWDANGEASDWAEPASFETGLLEPSDWAGAAWIGWRTDDHVRTGGTGDFAKGQATPRPAPPAPLLRKTFSATTDALVRARLYVCGLGYGEFHLDGQRVGKAVLDPAPTNYAKTVLYSTYDVTDLLRTAQTGRREHVLAAQLGRGRYGEPTPNVWYWEQAPWWDHPKLLALLVLTYADGRTERIVSDETWRCADGPIRFDSLYAGEVYDARHERPGWTEVDFDDSDEAGWQAAAVVPPPGGVLRSQQLEPIEPVAEISPAALSEPRPGIFVYDLGQQMSGWARLRLRSASSGDSAPDGGSAGTRVTVRYAEQLSDDGTVELKQGLIHGDIQVDHYICRGDPEERYEPRFSYKGFQYVQVEIDGELARPELSDLTGVAVHTAVGSTGEFECDDDLVNKLHRATRWAVLNNLHGVPTDTPVFEKNGWTGDAHLTAAVAAFNFHMPRFYTKWLQDWVDSQLPHGEFPCIVPSSGWGHHGDPRSAIAAPIPAWDVAYVEIPWVMYRYYGDERVLARHYDNARRYLDYIVDRFVEDDVMLAGLGDWLPPGVHGMPPEGPGVYETAYTYRFAELLSKFAEVLGRDSDVDGYRALMGRLASGFNRAFFDASSMTYHGEKPTGYRQSANVMALWFGLAPEQVREQVFANLVADIHARDDHLDTGVIGTKFLLPLLTENGEVDLAYTVATQRTYPGYGFWIEQGATSLYEHWHAESRSRNHHFFGHVDQWFVEYLAGLTPLEPGYRKVRVRPVPPRALGRARAAIESVHGRVAAEWHRQGDGYEVRVELPPGVAGEVFLPQPDGSYTRHTCAGPGTTVFGSQ